MTEATPAIIPMRIRIRHVLQREIGRLAAPFWVPLTVFVMRFIMGYRIVELAKIRAEFRRIREDSDAPLLICANHLTLIDSLILGWAINPTWRYLVHWKELPWNTPERLNFGATFMSRFFIYMAKCIPISRGGTRSEVAQVLNRVAFLLERGEVALVFPEGGRSRSGRVTSESIAWGVGRIVAAVPGCRVACIYLRGEAQEAWGSVPHMGDHFYAKVECIEPKSDFRGARRSRDLAGQIVSHLAHMEREYFDGRQ
jgi:1-acyl-sn-glycerol-3-phosphate acyltransferase